MFDHLLWLRSFVDSYRRVGLLSGYASMTDDDIVAALDELDIDALPELEHVIDDVDCGADLFSPIVQGECPVSPAATRDLDLRLLGLLDPVRVWWRWREFDEARQVEWLPGGLASLVGRLAELSGGQFVPTDVIVTGEPAASRRTAGTPFDATLEFTSTGRHYFVEDGYETVAWSRYDEPLVVPALVRVVAAVNSALDAAGADLAFRAHERLDVEYGYVPFNATAFAVGLAPGEEEAIAAARGWRFEATGPVSRG